MASKQTAPRINPDGNGSVSMEEFIRTRDSGLTKLNGAISTLISAYVAHTNTLLNSSGQNQAVLDTKELTDFLAGAGLAMPKVGGPLDAVTGKEKKKRPKKERDPNAPKRPLTAFFLFSTRARDHIKADLGAEATPVEINNEILRRWNEMDGPQKDRWKELYNTNYEAYKKEVEEYKAKTGQDITAEPSAPHEDIVDAKRVEESAAAGQSDDDDEDDESSEDEVVPEPPKAPTPPPKKTKGAAKGKKAAAAAAPAKSPSPSAQLQAPRSTVPIPLPTTNEKRKKTKEESPEQPKKKKAKKGEAAAPAAPPPVVPAPAPAAAPAEKKKKKSKKSDAA